MAKKRINIVTILIIAVVLIAVFLPGYTKLQDLVAENKRLEERIDELVKSVDSLEGEKEKLESDILYIEKVARQKFGVVREDEVVITEKK